MLNQDIKFGAEQSERHEKADINPVNDFRYSAFKSTVFSGNYHSDPAMSEFDHLKIHHHHSPHHKYEGDLIVVAYGQSSELLEMRANMITGEKADYFILNFGVSLEIQTIYEFKIALGGIEEDFILLGYENEDGHGRFLAIEEVFSDETEEKMLDLKSFKLIKKH